MKVKELSKDLLVPNIFENKSNILNINVDKSMSLKIFYNFSPGWCGSLD